MDIVVDTPAVPAVLLREPTRGAGLTFTAGRSLVAPPTLQWEVGNAIGAMVERRRLTLAEAVRVVEEFATSPIGSRPTSSEVAVRLPHEWDVYAYDADTIARARSHRLPLLTLDGGLKEAAGRRESRRWRPRRDRSHRRRTAAIDRRHP